MPLPICDFQKRPDWSFGRTAAVPRRWVTHEQRHLDFRSQPKLAVEEHRGSLARVLYGSKQMTGGDEQFVHARSKLALQLLKQAGGELDGAQLQGLFGDQKAGICVGSTIDMMVYDCTARTARLSRGPAWGQTWKTFSFEASDG